MGQLKSVFCIIEMDEVWNSQDPNKIATKTKFIVEKLHLHYYKIDTDKIMNSEYTPMYKLLDYRQGTILAIQKPLKKARIIHRAKMINTRIMYFNLNGNVYKINPEELCNICNTFKKENLYHLVYESPIYEGRRERFPRQLNERQVYEQLLKSLTDNDVNPLYYYLEGVLKLRSFIINE